MKRVFLSTSFSHKVDYASGEVLPDFRKELEQLLRGLRGQANIEVFCAMEHEKWKINAGVPPEVGIEKDLAEIDRADVLVALVHDQPSVGVQFEIGYCVAKGKPVLLAMQSGNKLAYFNHGLVSAGLVTLITYDDSASLVRQLTVALNVPGEELA
ncbi:MAG TPA: nucleoside 2-deoxyribosyltransferase [Candidatus Saccharimonadales bacterium]|nr:nucleoside 2-deoxyribosyltransferase [Candidatus Saccharimonadales bacterium]